MDNEQPSLRDIVQRASDLHGGARGRSLDREAKRLGLTLSYTTVDKILAGKYTSRPTKATLEALSKMAQVPLSTVYEAANMVMPMRPLAEQLPPEVDTLKADQRRIVIDLARQFVKQNKHEQELRKQLEEASLARKQDDIDPQHPHLRAVAPAGDAGPGQKTGPDDSIIEFHGAEAEKYPAPPIEQLAAHPKVKTRREQLDEQTGERDSTN